MIGKVLGHYLILKKFRADGTVEVYLAQDTTLGRLVTLKFFSAETEKSPGIRERFLNDARVIAELDHPGICQIHEVGKIEGRDFIAMEYIDGETLKERLTEGPMPLTEVLRVGCEVAEALAEAQEKGVVHQNLKPSNILLTQDGHAKVTDFGLAREVIPSAKIKGQKDPVRALSRSGVTAGTVSYYMSPEQLRGEAPDARSDAFAFGVILYEMAGKTHPFKKQTGVDTVQAILSAAPRPLTELQAQTPLELQRLVEGVLAKEPQKRTQSLREVQSALQGLLDASTRPAKKERKPIQLRRWLPAAGLVIVIAAIWAIVRFFPASRASSVALFPIVPPMTCPSIEDGLALSPDGNWVAFRWNGDNQSNWDIYTKELDGAGFSRLTTDTAEECCPAWSPDGRWVAFLRHIGNAWIIYILSPSDGGERRLIEIKGPSRLSWSPDGKQLAFTDRRAGADTWSLWSISVDGSQRKEVTDPPDSGSGDYYPAYSPDGRYLAFIRVDARGRSILHVKRLADGETSVLTDSHSPLTLCWTGDSRDIVYSSAPETGEMSLWRISLDNKEPRKIQVRGERVWGPCASRNRLVFLNASGDYDIRLVELTGGAQLKVSEKPILISTFDELNPSFSPDGRKIAFVSTRSGNKEVWVCARDGTMPLQITDLRAGDTGNPRWSPDGKWIAFDSTKSGSSNIYVTGAEGWPVRRVTTDSAEEAVPRWSRDGRWIYFGSSRSGDWEIWRVPSEGGRMVQITKSGGLAALESSDGRYLYYQAHYLQKKGIWRVPVGGGQESLVLEGVESHLLWDLADRGIFFLNRAAKPRAALSFYDFATQRLTDWPIEGDHLEFELASGLSVSADGKYLVYSGAIPGFAIAVDSFQ